MDVDDVDDDFSDSDSDSDSVVDLDDGFFGGSWGVVDCNGGFWSEVDADVVDDDFSESSLIWEDGFSDIDVDSVDFDEAAEEIDEDS